MSRGRKRRHRSEKFDRQQRRRKFDPYANSVLNPILYLQSDPDPLKYDSYKERIARYDGYKRLSSNRQTRRPPTTSTTPTPTSLVRRNRHRNLPATTHNAPPGAPWHRKVCVSRRQRRRTIFGLGKAGKGVRGPIVRRYNQKSQVRCK